MSTQRCCFLRQRMRKLPSRSGTWGSLTSDWRTMLPITRKARIHPAEEDHSQIPLSKAVKPLSILLAIICSCLRPIPSRFPPPTSTGTARWGCRSNHQPLESLICLRKSIRLSERHSATSGQSPRWLRGTNKSSCYLSSWRSASKWSMCSKRSTSKLHRQVLSKQVWMQALTLAKKRVSRSGRWS